MGRTNKFSGFIGDNGYRILIVECRHQLCIVGTLIAKGLRMMFVHCVKEKSERNEIKMDLETINLSEYF